MSGQVSPLDLTQKVRLEVEGDPVGLNNLVPNPSGDMGAWGWLANPNVNGLVSNAAASGVYRLALTASVAGGYQCGTSLVKIPTGHAYVAGRMDIVSTSSTAVYYQARFAFYDANRAFLSQSTVTTPQNTTGVTLFLPGVAVPANAVYVQFQIYAGRNSTMSAGAAGDSVSFRQVMTTTATSNSFTGTVARRNLVPNPSFETDLTGWEGRFGSRTVFPIPTRAAGSGVGAYQASVSNDTTVRPMLGMALTTAMPVTGGLTYALTFLVAMTSSHPLTATITFDSGDTTNLDFGNVTNGPFQTAAASFSVPTAAKSITSLLIAGYNSIGANETLYLDAVFIERADTYTSPYYFDGNTTGAGVTYAWTGTANLSPSTATVPNFAYAAPITWRNILNQSHEITVVRPALDLGTLSATIVDPNLDPAVSTALSAGRRCRITSYDAASSAWQPFFTGRISDASTGYQLDKQTGKVTTVVTLSAVDAMSTLANASQPQGVGTVAALPYLFQNASLNVPWNCDGVDDYVAGATITSNNPSASFADQIASVRDTVLGQAWVDRQGILQIVTTPSTTPSVTYSRTGASGTSTGSYSDLDVAYSRDTLINQVTLQYLRYNAVSGQTDTVTYGPFLNQDSIDKYGVAAATFTVQGISESATNMATLAASVLAKNSTTYRRPTSMTFPVKDAGSMTRAVTTDLCSVLAVSYIKPDTTTLLTGNFRVTSITHHLSVDGATQKWTITYGFDPSSTVATPQTIPSAGNLLSIADGSWIVPTLLNGWVQYDAIHAVGYMRKNGIVYLRGAIKSGSINAVCAALPAGYRPATTRGFATQSNTMPATGGIDSSGNVYMYTGGNSYFYLDFCYPAEA